MNCLLLTSGKSPRYNFPKSLVEMISLEEDRSYEFEEMIELVSHVFDDCEVWHYEGPDWETPEGDIIFNPLTGDSCELIRASEIYDGFGGIDLGKV